MARSNYVYQLEINDLVVHEAEIKYDRINIRKVQTEAADKLARICEEIDKMEETRINIDKWYSLEAILIKLGIEYYKTN